jgi:hypothetical protein
MSGMIAGLHTSSLTLVSGSYAYPVTNLGTIDITASGPALYAASRWSVVNLGTIVGENTSGSSGILLAGGGSITNAAAGLIEGYVAVTISGGGYVDNASTGTIAGWGGDYGGGTSASPPDPGQQRPDPGHALQRRSGGQWLCEQCHRRDDIRGSNRYF